MWSKRGERERGERGERGRKERNHEPGTIKEEKGK